MNLLNPGIKLSTINGHLICGLCGGYLIDATVLTECIHVFCRSCILKYLCENKVCPLCQSLVQETRPGQALRPDTALQRIVYKLVPGLLKTEMKRLSDFKASIHKSTLSTETLSAGSENTSNDPKLTSLYPPLPTPLATRSLSKSPCGLISNSYASTKQSITIDQLPNSASFLINDNELISLCLTQLDDYQYTVPSYSQGCENINSKSDKQFKFFDENRIDFRKISTRSLPSSPSKSNKSTDSIYLLCPAVVTIANLHRLLLAKYQLDPMKQVVDIYLDGECLEASHSLREVAFLYAFPTRYQRMCLQYNFVEACAAWWGRPMPRLERLQPKRTNILPKNQDNNNSVLNCTSTSDLLHSDKLLQSISCKNKKRASF